MSDSPLYSDAARGVSVEMVPIEQITQDPGNLRQHPEHNAGLVSRSIEDLGIVRPVAVDKHNQLIAGNQTTESAMQAGYTQALIVETAGDVLIVHRRPNLNPEQRLMAAFLDNHSSDTSMFADERVGQAIFEHEALFDEYLSKAEKNKYLLAAGAFAGKQELNPDQGGKLDLAPDLANKYGIAPGQIWAIPSLTVPGGEHLLALGDSRDAALISRLFSAGGNQPARMLAFDPPYGVDYASKNRMLNKLDMNNNRGHRSRLETDIQGDKMTPAEVEQFIRDILIVWGQACTPGASVYITGPSGDLVASFIFAFQGSPFKFHQTLVWVKNNFVLGTQDYHYRHEHVFYGWMPNGTHYWCGSRSLDSVIEIDMPRSAKLHPTMKPPELFTAFILNSSQPGEIVCDPTAGSGSTCVSAEQEGRLCYMGELCDPLNNQNEDGSPNYGYGGVILERMFDLGLAPRLLEGARRDVLEGNPGSD